MSEAWLEGRVVENRQWTPSLFSLKVEAPRLEFEAGQFVRIALDLEPGNPASRVARPFSFVNPPQEPLLEFYGVEVPGGPLSPRLARLAPGDVLYVSPRPAGFLVLSELPDAEVLWLLATGTGIAPFLSILGTETPWRRFRQVVLVHGVRTAGELVYQDAIRRTRAKYVPLVSREAHPGALAGRIPAAIRDGRLEAAAGLALSAQTAQVMLCGNPDMLRDAQVELKARGLQKNRRRTPGHITVESFW